MKVYIAGPMSGRPQFNYPAFAQLAHDLRKQVTGPGEHMEVFSPAEADPPHVQAFVATSTDGVLSDAMPTHGDFLGRAVKTILDGHFDAIVTLPEWETSKGARIEVATGMVSGAKICKVEYAYLNRPYIYEMTRGELLRGLEGEA